MFKHGLRFDSVEQAETLARQKAGFMIRYYRLTVTHSQYRNSLGVKSKEDWIFNLNIGNVMFLSPMENGELDYPVDRFHELNKDAMLEKIVLTCA